MTDKTLNEWFCGEYAKARVCCPHAAINFFIAPNISYLRLCWNEQMGMFECCHPHYEGTVLFSLQDGHCVRSETRAEWMALHQRFKVHMIACNTF